MVTDRSSADAFLDPEEGLVFEGLERADGDFDGAAEILCREHPDRADELRERLAALRAAGFGAKPPGEDEVFPDRLGDFRLLRRLGGGGMGLVYLAEQESLRRRVALKLIRPEHLYFERSRERFQREMEAVGRLQHPAVVAVHLVGEEQGIPYLAMELVAGCTLAELVEDLHGRPPHELTGRDIERGIHRRLGGDGATVESEHPFFAGSWVECCLRIVKQVAEGLQHAHENGILHRDIKPTNIMITPSGRVTILDFGLAHLEGSSHMTVTGSTIGSLRYMTPEQIAQGRIPDDPRVDVYALGVTLYELLTLRPPFTADSSEVARQLILRARPEPPARHNKLVPWDVGVVCATAMERDTARRYPSAAAFARDLGNLLELRPIEARRPGYWLRCRRWAQRHPAMTVGLAVAAVLVVVASTLLWSQAAAARARVQLRTDALRLAALLPEADRIRPHLPEEVALSDSWVAEASALRQRIADYATEHAELSAAALPLTAAEREARERHTTALEEDLADYLSVYADTLQRRRVTTAEPMSWQSFDALEERIAATRQALAEPLPRRFADPARGERFALLARLVARRGALERAIAAVEERRHRAAVMDEVCREAHAAQWEAVIAAIADPSAHPFYGGLEIPVQRGLVPLGPDPDSGLQEFAHYGSGAVPERDPETGRLQLAADMAIVLVLIPGGFLPDDPISIPPFFLGKYEVTQGQWSALTGANPSRFRAGTTLGDEEFTALHPVEWVNWYECRDVLSAVGLSLPDGRQWELATRAGTVTAWWTGDTEASIEGAGNLWDEAAKRQYPGQTAHRPWDDGLAHTAPVGMFRANPFGLHDVIGNVSEWCRDAHVFDETTESPDPDRDHVRTIRGSSFNAGTTMSRSAVAGYGDAIWRMFRTGVRAARAVER